MAEIETHGETLLKPTGMQIARYVWNDLRQPGKTEVSAKNIKPIKIVGLSGCADLSAGFTGNKGIIMITKSVEYAYPTSTNAERFGFGKTGCYTVELSNNQKPSKAVAAFATFEEARIYAVPLPYTWNRYTI